MAPTEETPPTRYYWIQLRAEGGSLPAPFRVRADTICGSITKPSGTIELKRDGNVVAKIDAPIHAWWIEEEPAR